MALVGDAVRPEQGAGQGDGRGAGQGAGQSDPQSDPQSGLHSDRRRRLHAAVPRRRPIGDALPALLAASPLLVVLFAVVVERPPITTYGDIAVIQLEVRDLLRGHELLGAYSRFGWHHPGPAFLLPLALASWLFAGAHWALDAGMLAYGAAAAAAIVWVTARAAGRQSGWLAAVVVALYVHAVGLGILRQPWNPWGLLLPMVLLVVLAASGAGGSLPSLAAAALAATILVQTHVGSAPVALAVLAVALGMGLPRRRDRHRRTTIVLAGVTVALWVPPVMQQVTGSDPNLTELAKFFMHHDGGQSLSTAVATVGAGLRVFPFGSSAYLTHAHPTTGWGGAVGGALTIAAYLVAAVVVAGAGSRRGVGFAKALGVLSAVSIAAAVVAVTGISGSLDGFLVGWVTALPIAIWIGAAALVDDARSSAALRVTLAAAVGVGVAPALVGATTTRSARTDSAPQVATLWSELGPQLAARPRSPVAIRIGDIDAWPAQAGVALLLDERGWPVRVSDDWVFMFGTDRRATGSEPLVATMTRTSPQGPAEQLTLSLSTSLPTLDEVTRTADAARIAAALGGSG